MKCTDVCTLADCENYCEDENEIFDGVLNEDKDSWDDRQELFFANTKLY